MSDSLMHYLRNKGFILSCIAGIRSVAEILSVLPLFIFLNLYRSENFVITWNKPN